MSSLYILPIGEVYAEILKNLEIGLWETLGFDIAYLPKMEQTDFALDKTRSQFSSTLILKEMMKRIPHDAVRVLGITENDLFIPMLSFVFGHAQVSGKLALISTARLRQEFYQLPKNDELLFLRTVKEALHELGHTFGLLHCADTTCAMSLSNGIQQVDFKKDDYCRDCRILFNESSKNYKMNGVANFKMSSEKLKL
ncbi:MAG: archaemetzincin family Zn-dependent metalloprotease [Bacteroidetes bacterium]|nr:archaemetzincin family Zn-dependent metalloprotease [Bacteroidota bacterium]